MSSHLQMAVVQAQIADRHRAAAAARLAAPAKRSTRRRNIRLQLRRRRALARPASPIG